MNSFFEKFGMNGIIRLKRGWLVLLALLAIPAWMGIDRLTMNSSNESFMPDDDPVAIKNVEFKEIFGSEEFFCILIEAEDIYSPETLANIRDLQWDLEDNLPFVNEVTSIYNTEIMESDGFFLNISSMEDDGFPGNSEEQDMWKERHLSSLLIKNRLISGDGKTTGIFVSLEELPEGFYARADPDYSPFKKDFLNREGVLLSSEISDTPEDDRNWIFLEDPRKHVAATMQTLLDEHQGDDFKLTVTGGPVIDYNVDKLTGREAGFFGLLSLIVAAALLIALYRDFRALMAPLLVFALTSFYVFGLMGWIGMDLTLMTIVLIPLILVIAVSYSIHFINQIRQGLQLGLEKKKVLSRAYAGATWPCFLTAVTTAAGFLSFLFAPMIPIKQLGLQCAIGTMTAFVLVIVLVPLFYLPGKTRPAGNRKQNSRLVFWEKWNKAMLKNSLVVTIIALVLSAFAVWGITRIKITADMQEMIGTRAQFVQDIRHVTENLGGAYSAEFLIELPGPEMAYDPDVLKTMDEAAAMTRELEDVNLTLSLADLVLELDRVFMDKSPQEASIPDQADVIAQYLILYETSGGDVLDSWTDLEYRTLRLSALFGSSRSNFSYLENDVRNYLLANLPPGTEVTLTGDLAVMVRNMTLLINSQIRSCLAALGFIAILLILILRSIRLGVLAIIPNLFPILITLGLMGWAKLPLDYVTAMVAPMLIGIVVDDIVHFFVHYKQIRLGTEDPEEATRKTFQSVGNALVFTSVVLTGGFILFAFSRMSSLQHMGILAAAGITIALLSDICLSPLLLKRFDNKRSLRRKNNENNHEISNAVMSDA